MVSRIIYIEKKILKFDFLLTYIFIFFIHANIPIITPMTIIDHENKTSQIIIDKLLNLLRLFSISLFLY